MLGCHVKNLNVSLPVQASFYSLVPSSINSIPYSTSSACNGEKDKSITSTSTSASLSRCCSLPVKVDLCLRRRRSLSPRSSVSHTHSRPRRPPARLLSPATWLDPLTLTQPNRDDNEGERGDRHSFWGARLFPAREDYISNSSNRKSRVPTTTPDYPAAMVMGLVSVPRRRRTSSASECLS